MNTVRENNVKKLLDIRGTQNYWKDHYNAIKNLEVTVTNLSEGHVTFPNFKSRIGDATNLYDIKDNEYDLVFSNSVIEHLFRKDNQKKMAEEIKRVGKSYFIQTPNRFFPLEPHFLVPFFQFFPFAWQLFLLRNFHLGHVGKISEKERAKEQINEIRLLSRNEFKELFSEATIFEEKFLFLTKSFVAYYKK